MVRLCQPTQRLRGVSPEVRRSQRVTCSVPPRHPHDTYELLEDEKFVYNLMKLSKVRIRVKSQPKAERDSLSVGAPGPSSDK